MKVIIALGSNVGDRAGYLHEGLQKISSLGTVVAVSYTHLTLPTIYSV